jgi:tetratricopeptide (TPR) repeat protein
MFRYKAFVSYSWSDAAWGKWLHHAIETFRTPAALVGTETPLGPVPARLHPLFKDREEEAAGSSIGNAVESALGASEFLIVICSPRSAASVWVNREIAWFKRNRDPARILALIVDGEPGSATDECFPAALTHRIADDLTITDIPDDAPLAADARSTGDGKRLAKLKIAAAMLGVGLDELVRRDERRRTIRTRIVVGAALALAAVMTALAWMAVVARNEAEHQRAESDSLVEFMLTDLRKRLDAVGRLDALDVVGQRALKYYAGQKPGSLDADALGRRSRALHLVGEVRDLRGDSTAALVAFRQAAGTTGELLARDPENGQRIFDHAQSVYWVGYVAYQRGQAKEAEAAFRDYKLYADKLVQIDPKNPDWQMETSYAESNLGTLLFDAGRYLEAQRAFAASLRVVEGLAAKAPNDTARQIEVGGAISWLAKAREYGGRPDDAVALLGREVQLYRRVLQSDSGNATVKNALVTALDAIGRIQMTRGDVAASATAYRLAGAANQELVALEPKNSLWREKDVSIKIMLAELSAYASSYSASRTMLNEAFHELDALNEHGPALSRRNFLLTRATILDAALTEAEGNERRALAILLPIRDRLRNEVRVAADEDNSWFLGRAELQIGNLLAKSNNMPAARESWRSAMAASVAGRSRDSGANQTTRYAALMQLNRTSEAAAIAQELDRRGYRHPLYTRARSRQLR